MSNNTNTGNYNSGYYNGGDYNSGYYNGGDYNSGNYNSGDYNSGNYNSGNYNSGYYNSGYYNSGNYNSGDYNSGYYNSGWFNTNEPKMRFFNKDSEYTYSEFIEKFNVYCPYLHTCEWIYWSDMTDEEKNEIPEAKDTDGYLKTLSYKDAWEEYWNRASDNAKEFFLNLPNFDADIFKEITGIDVNKPKTTIIIGGKEYSEDTIKLALQEYVK